MTNDRGAEEKPPLFDLLSAIRPVARRHGYAVAIHGSLSRDIDLVAIPWINQAAEPGELAEAIRVVVGGHWREDRNDPADWRYRGSRPEPKPHGRLAYLIELYGYHTYLDLSVMPLASPRPGEEGGT